MFHYARAQAAHVDFLPASACEHPGISPHHRDETEFADIAPMTRQHTLGSRFRRRFVDSRDSLLHRTLKSDVNTTTPAGMVYWVFGYGSLIWKPP
jgi:hypothetical protein